MHGQIKPTGTGVDQQRTSVLRAVSDGLRALEKATDPAEVLEIGATLEGIEQFDALDRPVQAGASARGERRKDQGALEAGQVAARDRAQGTGPGRGKAIKDVSRRDIFFRAYLKQIELDKTRAIEAQRIGAMPEPKLEKACWQPYRGTEEFMTFRELIIHARPFWHQEKRVENHERIIRQAAKASKPDPTGWGRSRCSTGTRRGSSRCTRLT